MTLNEVWTWFVTSSADPEKTSATIKGLLKVVAAQIIHLAVVACTLGVACAFGDLSWLNDAADFVGAIVYGGLIVWGAVQGIFGIARKLYLGRWTHPAVLG